MYHLSGDSGDDNITLGEKLTITFDQIVNLSSIDLRSEGHNFTGWAANATFLLNGVSTLLPQGVGLIALNQTGSVFTFEFGGATPDQFYLASMTAAAPAVPEPETYALMAAGGRAGTRVTAPPARRLRRGGSTIHGRPRKK